MEYGNITESKTAKAKISRKNFRQIFQGKNGNGKKIPEKFSRKISGKKLEEKSAKEV